LLTLEGLINGAGLVPGGAELLIVPNREEAIATVLRGAQQGDVVSILGRGNVVEALGDQKVDDRTTLSRQLAVGGVRG
jgi:UDP-N-acetylmuramyl tripeptide synthase